ncbi:hypothetical protein HZA41_02605 [Candidatus Peregrinibacteria bacterium]|nr:hypothetical protein [Candidatus Peregrinibacteria bacterium]
MQKNLIKIALIMILGIMTANITSFALANSYLKDETFPIKNLSVNGQTQYTDIGNFIVAVINFILKLVTAILTGVIVFAGVRLIVSAGNENATQRGKDILINALLGLLLVLSAYIITVFVQYLIYQPPTT